MQSHRSLGCAAQGAPMSSCHSQEPSPIAAVAEPPLHQQSPPATDPVSQNVVNVAFFWHARIEMVSALGEASWAAGARVDGHHFDHCARTSCLARSGSGCCSTFPCVPAPGWPEWTTAARVNAVNTRMRMYVLQEPWTCQVRRARSTMDTHQTHTRTQRARTRTAHNFLVRSVFFLSLVN